MIDLTNCYLLFVKSSARLEKPQDTRGTDNSSRSPAVGSPGVIYMYDSENNRATYKSHKGCGEFFKGKIVLVLKEIWFYLD